MEAVLQKRLRLLIVPGLRDSGPLHWQTWLQTQYRGSVRVVQNDWHDAKVEVWADRIGDTLAKAGPGEWIVAAHSFGCLALSRFLGQPRPGHAGLAARIQAALLAAPADPAKFGCADLLPLQRLPCRATVVSSATDPWMSADNAALWADRWGCRLHRLGDAGHINAEAGFGRWPMARRWVEAMQQHHARARRPARAEWREWSFAL